MRSSMHPYHKEILQQIEQRAAEENAPLQANGNHYIGTSKPGYLLRAPILHELIRDWTKRHPELTPAEYVELLNSLAKGETCDEILVVGLLLGARPQLRKTLAPQQLDLWLEHAQGWAEVDTICQSNFTAAEMMAHWKEWKELLIALSKSDNIHKRRASLVLLNKPLRESDDPRLARLAFANVGRLKHEKDILITKAVSWVLRDLIKYHCAEVEAYLDENRDTLPKIAIRETRIKLQTGKKSGRVQSG